VPAVFIPALLEPLAGGLREPVSPSSEIHFVVAIRGG
jgi:hypothetical protein